MLTVKEIAQKTPKEIQFLHNEILKKETSSLESKLKLTELKCEKLDFELRRLLSQRYGSQSEQSTHVMQSSLFDELPCDTEPDEIAPAEELEVEEDITVPEHTRKKRGRKKLPEFLPRVRVEHDIPDSEKMCPCGCKLTRIDEEVSEQLDYIPASMQVIQTVRFKYACKSCEDTIKTAPVPNHVIPKSIATPGLLAHIFVSKFCDHLPFYRLESILRRIGTDISRGTFCRWTVSCASLLEPLVERMRQMINQYDVAFADETTLQVLKEEGRTAKNKSYEWLFIGSAPGKRCFVYQYDPSRAHDIPLGFLDQFAGYLHCDAYKGYLTLSNKLKTIKLVHCMAHARRKFIEIVKHTKKSGVAQYVVKKIAELYKLEKKIKEMQLSSELIYQKRQKHAAPILKKLKVYLEEQKKASTLSEPLSLAINYCLNHWDGLTRYLEDGRLEIDNNRSERSIKPFVIGRKNWLFHGNAEGAHAGSVIYSLIETCKAHDVDPYSYLKYVLGKIRDCRSDEQYDQLLPFNVDRDALVKMRDASK